MAGEEIRCAVRYDPKPLRGSLLTLTEQLWSALVDAQAAGLPASFRVGQNSVSHPVARNHMPGEMGLLLRKSLTSLLNVV